MLPCYSIFWCTSKYQNGCAPVWTLDGHFECPCTPAAVNHCVKPQWSVLDLFWSHHALTQSWNEMGAKCFRERITAKKRKMVHTYWEKQEELLPAVSFLLVFAAQASRNINWWRVLPRLWAMSLLPLLRSETHICLSPLKCSREVQRSPIIPAPMTSTLFLVSVVCGIK